MTYVEVHIAYGSIMKRKAEEVRVRNQELLFIAKCMGAEIDETKINNGTNSELTEDQEKAMDKAAQERLKEKGFKKWQT